MPHTPGPWFRATHYTLAPVIATKERRIAKVLYEGGSEDNEVEHNARLIAAAPDLLAACEEALAEIDYWHADMLTPEERAHPRGSGWARVWDKAQAAIAKARGSQ